MREDQALHLFPLSPEPMGVLLALDFLGQREVFQPYLVDSRTSGPIYQSLEGRELRSRGAWVRSITACQRHLPVVSHLVFR